MKRTLGLALASGLAMLVAAGCAAQGGMGGGAAAGPEAAATTPSGAQTASASAGSASAIRDFNLQVKCPGIHLEKTKLNWSEDKIMSHENVTPDQIASCEAWTASQPKGYVPPPPPGTVPAAGKQQAQSMPAKAP